VRCETGKVDDNTEARLEHDNVARKLRFSQSLFTNEGIPPQGLSDSLVALASNMFGEVLVRCDFSWWDGTASLINLICESDEGMFCSLLTIRTDKTWDRLDDLGRV
jgi:hypothetical protein